MDSTRYFGALVFLLMATVIPLTYANAVLSAEDMLRIQKQVQQMGQEARQNQILRDSQIVRPLPKERDAISKLLAIKPRPKTLNDADIKYLKDMLDKTTWFGFEKRIMHEMWAEVSGNEWRDTEPSQPPNNETTP